MPRYKITITMSGGDELRANVNAHWDEGAMRKLRATEQYQNWMADHFGESVTDTKIEKVEFKPRTSRIVVSNAPDKAGWYQVEHSDPRIKVEFRKGRFNETQKVWVGDSTTTEDPLEYATALREIADWLQAYFPELVAEPRQQRPMNEGAKPGKRPSERTGTVPCYFSLRPEYADFIKEQAKANGMSQGQFIEWMLTEDDNDNEQT